MATQTGKLTDNFTITVSSETADQIRKMADAEQRKPGQMTRILVEEAIRARAGAGRAKTRRDAAKAREAAKRAARLITGLP